MASNGNLLSIVSSPSHGQVQTIQSTGNGVSITSWFGQPGDTDTVVEITVSGPWSNRQIDAFSLPLVLDRYPSDRGRADILEREGEVVVVKIRYPKGLCREVNRDEDLEVLSTQDLTITVPAQLNLEAL